MIGGFEEFLELMMRELEFDDERVRI